jgi:hypothetical protein
VIELAYNRGTDPRREATVAIIGTDDWHESPKARAKRLQQDADDMASLTAAVEAAAMGVRLSAARIKAARGALRRAFAP